MIKLLIPVEANLRRAELTLIFRQPNGNAIHVPLSRQEAADVAILTTGAVVGLSR